jgi:hypothetical protein
MSKKQFNALPNFNSKNLNVDRDNGILKNVSIANFGKNKNNSYFDEKFISDLVEKGNAQTQGVKSRFGHPNMCSTSLGTYIGRYKNFNLQSGNCFADLHLDQITKKTEVPNQGIMMFNYIMDMAENNPDMFGNSIHITYIESDNPKLYEGDEILELNDITSSDLVDDPAATDALFSSNPNDLGVAVTEFLDNNPKIFETISKQPAIIQDFFERYANYSNRKSLINFNMNFLDKMKKKFSNKKEGETFDIDVTLADGSIVTVVTDAEQPQVGDQVVDDAGSPVPDNEHMLPDGSSIVTVGGAITEIKESAPADPAGEPTMADVMASVKLFGTQLTALAKKFDTAQKNNELAFEFLQDNFQSFEKQTKLKLSTIKSTYDVPPAEVGGMGKGNANKVYDADAVKEAREKLNNKNK